MITIDELLKYLNLDIDEFLFQFQSHPNYPSALAISDTLNFLGIENSAYELDKEYWREIATDFITLYNNKFALVKRELNANNYSVFSDKSSLVKEKELLKNSSDLVILLNKESKENNQKQNPWIPFLILTVFAFTITFFNFSWPILIYNFLSIIGIYISYEIFKEKFGAQSPILNTICGKVKSESKCNKVISSDKTNIYGLKLSDISLVYFIGLFFIGIFLGKITLVLLSISLFASGIILYSLYVQIFLEKRICKICLTIITILILQLLIAYFYINTFGFYFKEIVLGTFLFTIFLITISNYNKLLLKNNDLKKSNIKNLKFKRNYELFRMQLLDSDQTIFRNDYSSFFLGNRNANIHISLISNPFCGFCKDTHEIIERIIKKYPESVSIQIRFNYSDTNKDDNLKMVLSHFKDYYENFGESAFLQKVSEWFKERNLETIKKENVNSNINLSEEINIGQENVNLGFTFTPIFLINGYKFPPNYDRDDILYFIDELIEDEYLLIHKKADAEKLKE